MNYIKEKKELLIDNAFILIGCFIASLGVNLFLSNAKLLSGGATGIALIFQYLMGVNSGIVVLLINIPLFILSYFKLSKQFTFNSAIGMLALSVSLMITAPVSHLITLDDKLLYCVFGGAICGFGYGLVFSKGGSTGGTDIIAKILNKFFHIEIGKSLLMVDFLVTLLGAITFGINMGLYGLLSVIINGVVIDNIIAGFKTKSEITIISDKNKDISKFILNDLERGCTFIKGVGGFTGKDTALLYTVLDRSEFIKLKNKIREIDKNAFITVGEVHEVMGEGFMGIDEN